MEKKVKYWLEKGTKLVPIYEDDPAPATNVRIETKGAPTMQQNETKCDRCSQTVQACTCSPVSNQQTYEFDLAPGDVGWKPDGNHDWAAHKEWESRQERERQEVQQRQAFLANLQKAGSEYEFEPAPGDPDFDWGAK